MDDKTNLIQLTIFEDENKESVYSEYFFYTDKPKHEVIRSDNKMTFDFYNFITRNHNNLCSELCKYPSEIYYYHNDVIEKF